MGDDVPNVDVLITCCREDIDVIMDTTRAACALDYPRDRFRVFVCDDGASAEVKNAVENLHQAYPNVYYVSRIKDPLIKDYKAGNLNHALHYSRHLPITSSYNVNLQARRPDISSNPSAEEEFIWEKADTQTLRQPSQVHYYELSSETSCQTLASPPAFNFPSPPTNLTPRCAPSEFVAGLDADMIPEPHWLRTMMPHLVDDPDVSLACPPQTFYDIPNNDPLTQSMDHFAGTIELVNDALGHGDCLGSGYVVRRAAIESIGGFPVESLSEDVCCSATLLGAGWKTRFVELPVQYGSVPDSFVAHIKQRTRWFIGHIQTSILFRLRLFGNRGRLLTPPQRLVGIVSDLRQVIQILLFLNYIIIPYSLISGYPIVIWHEDFELKWLIRFAVIFSVCRWFHQAIMGVIFYLGRGWYETISWLGSDPSYCPNDLEALQLASLHPEAFKATFKNEMHFAVRHLCAAFVSQFFIIGSGSMSC
ncbi:uncharacterized protein yc1106_04809 [Curvularia clavata]|uniref:Glycosyltransferase 2-like domain-containing protein n=1 Tax=Curvularia clavata TaxID=95742 RepID=A0A9Q8Z8D5_CURCL|nr:uncharacterized protein yc1106_04809 [Curvularia clavata]